jgi:enoyl-[acyl-carrier protein] reductase III
MKYDFSNKVALVTGGSRGIGKNIAMEFAKHGADVAFNYLKNHKAATETQKEIHDLGVKCFKLKSHLGNEDKIIELFQQVKKEFGKIDFLINNAASGVQRKATELESKHWDWAMNINAKAPWLCSVEAAKLMPPGSSIINITSEGSRKVLPYYLSVGTSKAALESLTRYLAVELSDKGINVNAVSGGFVETGALDSFINKVSMKIAGKKTLANRMVTTQDIANITLFLCTKNAEMIKGQIIIVDGGVTLQANL